MLLDQPVDTLPVIDDYRWNRWASQSTVVAVLVWWAVVQLVGWVGWPLAFAVFRSLADRGHMLAKSLVLVVVAYLVWLPASFRLARNSLSFILVALGLVALLSLALLRRNRAGISRFWRERWRLILLNEALFTVAYLLFVWIRVLNPDLWQPWLGGEKFMDFAFLNATLKSAHFPPYDPYFAGGYLNYYYYGQYLVGLLIKLTGVAPTVAYNLIVPTLFAMTAGNSFCLGYNLLAGGKWQRGAAAMAGLAAAVFVAVAGNLAGFYELWNNFAEIGRTSFHSAIPGLHKLIHGLVGIGRFLQGQAIPAYSYWDPTRVIPHTINEFPFFSFLFADLHPHMINMSFSLLFVALLLTLVRRSSPEEAPAAAAGGSEGPGADRGVAEGEGNGEPDGNPQGDCSGSPSPALPRAAAPCRAGPGGSVLMWMMLPLVLGTLAVVNTWDFPTYWGLAVLAFLLHGLWQTGRFNVVGGIGFALALAGLSLLLFWPFFARYAAIHVGVGLFSGATEVNRFILVWGMFLFVAASALVGLLVEGRTRTGAARWVGMLLRRWAVFPHLIGLYRALGRGPSLVDRLTLFVVVVLFVEAASLALLGYTVLALLFLLIIPAFLLLLRWDAEPAEQFAVLLVFVGLVMLAGVEIFYMKDFLGGGEWRRMNTLFKFYIQVWLMFGVSCGALLIWLLDWVETWRRRLLRGLWTLTLVALLSMSLVYPVLGTGVRVFDRFPGARPPIGTLDGMAFMQVGSYFWPDENNRIELRYDYEAIRWLQDNLTGTPVIAEANLPYYREGGLRVSSLTGFPTLLGMHQSEQRYDWQVGERDGLAREFFNTPQPERAMQIIRELHISYIYVGQLEQTVYAEAGLQKFDRMAEDGRLRLVYENPKVKIYAMNDGKES